MLQNRVDPFGTIIRTPERGHWTGNRGVLHNVNQEIERPYRLKAWITCALSFRGRRRSVMSPNRWTELFFFDEATAFSAGHRPCFECRHADALRFKQAWIAGNPGFHFDGKTPVREIDNILHRERLTKEGSKQTFEEGSGALPNGSFIAWQGGAWLLWDALAYKWSPGGYQPGIPAPAGKVTVLTPRSVVAAFGAGYLPGVRLPSGTQ